MKDIYKNPLLYYIGIPLVVALWVLLVRGVYLPRSQKAVKDKENEYNKAYAQMEEIIKLDPDRATDSNEAPQQFSYSDEVYRVAKIYNIPASKCTQSSKGIVKTRDQKTQGATVVLQDIDVESFAKFLSALQFRWPGLECERIKLTQTKGPPDTWRIDITLKYYYTERGRIG
jgi:hypothetical protein